MAMMPAFATDTAADLSATDTVSVERLRAGVERMVRDGANVIATTGSFGECHTLLPAEFRTLAHETAAAVRRRIPLFIGVTSANARETVEKMRVVAESAIISPQRSRMRCAFSATSRRCFPSSAFSSITTRRSIT